MKKNIAFCLILFVLFSIFVIPVSAKSNNSGNGQWLAIGKTNKITCVWESMYRNTCLTKIPSGTTIYIIQVSTPYTYYVKYYSSYLDSLIRTWVTVTDVQVVYYCSYNLTPGRCKDFTH